MFVWPLRARMAVLSASLALAALSLARATPPAPLPADAAPDAFSAGRARDTLATLLGDQSPHPVGSASNAALRARLVAALRALGLEPEEQRAFACSPLGSCATVHNLIAWLPGQGGPALALLAHHDSVPAGPGAADDGHGVALVLEVLRALRDLPRRAPLAAVFTDGEELGLLGARAFTTHPRFREIGVVLNAEARGTTGPARMFETSDDNAALVAAFSAAPHPSAQSLSYEIYRRLPNDTDLTVFKDRGVQGMNFAFIGGVQRYHTPRDDLAHLDLGSLQQQGDAVLASARGLLATDLSQRAADNASYVDLLGAVLLRWPAWLDLPLAALALLSLLLATRLPSSSTPPAASTSPAAPTSGSSSLSTSTPSGRPSLRGLLLAIGTTLLAPLLGAAAGHATLLAIEALSGPLGPWPAVTVWPLLAIASTSLALPLALLRLSARRTGARAQALGTWLLWALLALVLACTIPGATILLLAPALLAAPLALTSRRALLPAALAALLACALWPPLIPALTDALGLSGLFVGAIVGWLVTALAPFCAEEHGHKALSRATWLILLLGLVAGVLAARAPRVDLDHPARLNLIHLTDLDTGAATYLADAPAGLPPDFAAATAWGPPQALLPWSARALPSAPAAPLPSGGATLTPRGGDSYLLRARPGALAIVLQIPAGSLASLSLAGQPLDPGALRHGPSDTRIVTLFGPPPEGIELTAARRDDAPWRIAELVSGLPPGSPAAQRPDTAVPYQWGDLSVTVRAVTFAPAPRGAGDRRAP